LFTRARKAGSDPGSKLVGAISVILANQVSYRLCYCKRDQAYFTTLLWQTMDSKMALYREYCFLDCTKL